MAITAASILPVYQHRQQAVGQVLDDLDRRQRQVADGWRQRVGEEIGRDRRDDADPQRAGERVPGAARGGRDVGGGGECAAGVIDDRRRAAGDADDAAFAFEQPHAQRLLELEDLAAERRLTDVAGRGGAAEMAVIRDGDDILQVSQVHGASLYDSQRR